MRKVILASASRWRKEVFEKSRIPFVVETSDYVEDMDPHMSPKRLARMLAEGKAQSVAIRHKSAVVIGADVFAEYDGKKLGKPITPQKAKQMLTLLSGKTHLVYTGYCIIDAKNGKKKSGVVVTKVTFRKLAREEIDAYVATKEPLAVAGAYAIQKGAASFCTKVVGDYYAIVGFPLSRIVEELRDFGISAD